MEMERINENTIRVILGSQDLEERGITVLDLLGNRKQIESFFYSILEEIDQDHTFASDDAVTFQVMPNQNGLELLISRISPDSLQHDDSDNSTADSSVSDDNQLKNFIRRKLQERDNEGQETDTETTVSEFQANEREQRDIVLCFNDSEAVIQLAMALRLESGFSTLYRYKDAYYLDLTLFPDNLREQNVEDIYTIAREYGNRTNVTAEVLAEYGQPIIHQTALELLRHYFD